MSDNLVVCVPFDDLTSLVNSARRCDELCAKVVSLSRQLDAARSELAELRMYCSQRFDELGQRVQHSSKSDEILSSSAQRYEFIRAKNSFR